MKKVIRVQYLMVGITHIDDCQYSYENEFTKWLEIDLKKIIYLCFLPDFILIYSIMIRRKRVSVGHFY